MGENLHLYNIGSLPVPIYISCWLHGLGVGLKLEGTGLFQANEFGQEKVIGVRENERSFAKWWECKPDHLELRSGLMTIY